MRSHAVGDPDRVGPAGGEPAIHRDVLAGDEASSVAREEGRDPGVSSGGPGRGMG